uniref:Uncharacterized protein n=1 Tax=Cucumis melo TaxID=3656 RepID=A0A9I9EM13_CUCME
MSLLLYELRVCYIDGLGFIYLASGLTYYLSFLWNVEHRD